MVTLTDGAGLAFLLCGHVALWVALFNRMHALPLPCRVLAVLEKLHIAAMAAGPAACLWWALRGAAGAGLWPSLTAHPALAVYAVICGGVALIVAGLWCWRQLAAGPPPQLAANHTAQLDVAANVAVPLVGNWTTALLARVPGNQMLQLHVHDKTLLQPRLDAALDGLTIAHLSDLHFTGKIRREYFDHVVDRTNELDADLVAVTGDIVDVEACVEWIPHTLGRLTSRLGVYFVLGNHDRRLRDVAALRRTLTGAGLIDLGGRCVCVSHRGAGIVLAGNELPWFGPPGDPGEADRLASDGPALRVLLSHSPDQLPWARRHHFDLLLAGHTHGGQIRFPVIGPVLTPSLHGTKYASGVFYEAPTLMHVSRGISGLDPIRLNCPPELAKLTLRR